MKLGDSQSSAMDRSILKNFLFIASVFGLGLLVGRGGGIENSKNERHVRVSNDSVSAGDTLEVRHLTAQEPSHKCAIKDLVTYCSEDSDPELPSDQCSNAHGIAAAKCYLQFLCASTNQDVVNLRKECVDRECPLARHFHIPTCGDAEADVSTFLEPPQGNDQDLDDTCLPPDVEEITIEVTEAEQQRLAEEQQALDEQLAEEAEGDLADEEEKKEELANEEELDPEEDDDDDVESFLNSTSDPTVDQPEKLEEEPDVDSPLVYDNGRKLGHGHHHDEHNMHMPLACNVDLEDASCSSFSSLLSSADPGVELVVPCGECVEVDISDQSEVLLENGLRIEGKLYFPSTASVTFRTKYIWVLGLLKMDTPAVGNQVKFRLYSDELQTFVSGNDGHCSSGCNMGSKVIAVHGGQVDIQGTEESCPAWEKLTDLGASELKSMKLPCNTWNKGRVGTKCWESDTIELTGKCVDEGSRMRCPIKSTGAYIGSGTREAIKFTSVGTQEQWNPPCNTWNTRRKGTKCWKSDTIELAGPCVQERGRARCPIKPTGAFIGSGSRDKIKFTSVAAPAAAFVLPKNTWNVRRAGRGSWKTNEIKLTGPCVDQRNRVRCPIAHTGAWVGSGSRERIKFTSATTGKSMTSSHIMHWSWAGKYLFFKPDQSVEEINKMFSKDETLVVDLQELPALGQSMTSSHIIHWSWGGRTLYFKPDQSIEEINRMFAKGFQLKVEPADSPPALGQSMTSSDIIHWSWKENTMYFRPDQSIEDINSMFVTGMRLKVEKVVPDTETYEIKVSKAAVECWHPGTEVLLTSHTRNQNDQQVAVIESSDPESGIIRFTKPIEKPISLADHPDFAVEVASLNRRIVFEAEDDADDELIGGHFVVHHTSSEQHIEGVEIRNFGQQGRLGKYPLHFHMCGDSHGSLVKKNVVRQSNQRCYVIHLTNYVTLEDNVAYDTVGHCYFIEDGAEIENVFKRNLGSGIKTMPSDRVAQLEAKSKRDETDDAPHGFNGAAVFWISNPQNHFTGNVAAGGQKNGYWFETRGTRVSMALGTFKDNEVHSCHAMAFSTYAPGWRPNKVANIDNLKVYRNTGDGAFLHVTRNLHFNGGLFADNGSKDVFITRGDNIQFDGTSFMGQTKFTSKGCRRSRIGIHLDTFRLHETVLGHYNGEYRGTIVKNATFQNYSREDTGCNSAPMKLADHQTFLDAYNAPHTIQDVKFDTPSTLDACMTGSGIDDVQIEIASDVHGAFTGEQGFLVSPRFSSMIATGCQSYNKCLDFCPGACLRTVSVVAGDASFADDIVMIVKDSLGNEIKVERDVRGFPRGMSAQHHIANVFASAYTVVLPKGSFEVRFESKSLPLPVPVWPGYAVPVFETAPSCTDNYITESDLTFIAPAEGRPECDRLIRNGNFDEGIDGWNAFHNRQVKFLETSGIGRTGALITDRPTSQGCLPSQVIDASCLQAGAEYEIQVSYKIVDEGANESHEGMEQNLPIAKVQAGVFDTSDLSKKRWKSVGRDMVVARTSADSPVTGWRTMKSTWTVSEEVAGADKVKFYISGGPDYLLVDSVSIERVGPLVGPVGGDGPGLAESGLLGPGVGPAVGPGDGPGVLP